MTYYADLAPCDYFGQWADVLLAVGWLDPEHTFSRGLLSKEVFDALVQLLVDPWQPMVAGGGQPCLFCRFTGGPGPLHVDGKTVAIGSSNLFLPAGEKVMVAPSLILHYIDAHEYCPPDLFQQAVLHAPKMRSIPYLRAILARGLGKKRT